MSTSRKRQNPNRQNTGATARIESLRPVVAKSNRTDVQMLDRLAACTVSLEPAGPLAGKDASGLANVCSEKAEFSNCLGTHPFESQCCYAYSRSHLRRLRHPHKDQ